MRGQLFVLFLMFLAGCSWTPEAQYLKSAKKAIEKKEYTEAVEALDRAIKAAPESDEALEAAEKGAEITETYTGDPRKQVGFLRHLVLYSKNQPQRELSQIKLAETYFEKLEDYEKAEPELNRTVLMIHDPKKQSHFRLMLARDYYFLKKFFQARAEIEVILKENVDQELSFKAELLKANTYFAEKNLDAAANLYQRLMTEYPEKSKTEKVGLSLAVCFEEKEDINKAIQVLEGVRSIYPNPEIIDLKIQRLKSRQAQMPGAKGLKK